MRLLWQGQAVILKALTFYEAVVAASKLAGAQTSRAEMVANGPEKPSTGKAQLGSAMGSPARGGGRLRGGPG